MARGWLGGQPDDPYSRADEAAKALRDKGFGDHDVVIVLGSGWQTAADSFGEAQVVVPMTEVPGFIAPIAEGHGSDLRSYDVGGRRVLALLGRTHLYEGHGPQPVVHGIRTAAALGCRTAILTNANGSFRRDWRPGTCMLVRDHLNLTATSPLVGPRFVDLTEAYATRLREAAKEVHPDFAEGVYAMLPGPHYETRAEGQMLAKLGADAVGMSTVLEVIAARELGLEVLALSMVTVTEGLDTRIDPRMVVEVAAESASALGPKLARIIAAAKGSP
ncbi:MAG: purine-nucleoside phosphorylase [Nocardioidaceae bacterium]